MVSYDKNHIYVNGKAEKIISGAMHYFRIMPEYWQDRLLKLKESGCNCVETYMCWSLHEKKEGIFDFSGMLDLGRFLDMAKEMGLYAIVRPGPFICSETDLGGMPWWILKHRDISLRCTNERFLSVCTPYLERVCEILAPHLITRGGNVIFVQIENEYGYFANDKKYLEWLKDLYVSHGIDCGFVTSDGANETMLRNGALEGVLMSVNYRWDSKTSIDIVKKIRNDQPGAVMELWNGMGMRWETPFVRRDLEEVKASLSSAIENAELINLYMFHGGTTFGFMNGARDYGERFEVQMTSYDVDAPLDEYGRRTPKYYAEQKIICESLGKEIVNTAKDTVIESYDARYIGECSLSESDLSPLAFDSPAPEPMEFFDQGYGYIAYETTAELSNDSEMTLPTVHDIAHVYIDGRYVKTVCRYSTEKSVFLKVGTHRISVLVENLGRVNCGPKLEDRKGLIGDIIMRDMAKDVSYRYKLFGFKVYSLPIDTLPTKYDGKAVINEPAFYKYEFMAEKTGDTVLNFKGFTRGVAFINGFNLGRHWDTEGSENKLFIPAPLIRQGKNEIVVFDVLHRDAEKELILGEI